MTNMNFDDFRHRAESDPVSFMLALQPGGRYDQGQREYYAATPQGGAGRSCKTSLRPDKMFVGRDFASSGQSWSGPIDLACAAFDISKNQPQEAVKRACGRLGWQHAEAEPGPGKIRAGTWPDFTMGGRQPSLVSSYRNPDGSIFCHVARYEAQREGGRKSIIPYSYGELNGVTGWHRKMPPGARPLLGLDELLPQRGNKPVLVVEGEKTREAARRLAGGRFLVTTWMGGCQAVEKSDFRILDGSSTYVWPDADEPGRQAALKIAAILKQYPGNRVFIVRPPEDVKSGWDLADAEAVRRLSIMDAKFKRRLAVGPPAVSG